MVIDDTQTSWATTIRIPGMLIVARLSKCLKGRHLDGYRQTIQEVDEADENRADAGGGGRQGVNAG